MLALHTPKVRQDAGLCFRATTTVGRVFFNNLNNLLSVFCMVACQVQHKCSIMYAVDMLVRNVHGSWYVCVYICFNFPSLHQRAEAHLCNYSVLVNDCVGFSSGSSSFLHTYFIYSFMIIYIIFFPFMVVMYHIPLIYLWSFFSILTLYSVLSRVVIQMMHLAYAIIGL